MIPALLLNAGINLAVGLGLLFVWRVDRGQPFSRWLGWSFVTQACIPPAYAIVVLGWSGAAAAWLEVSARYCPKTTCSF